jgi:hypothetical protein
MVCAYEITESLDYLPHPLALGRQHCGTKGDYLVESNDGVLSIARRQIFEDVYVPLTEQMELAPESASSPFEIARRSSTSLPSPGIAHPKKASRLREAHPSFLPLLARKSPQPYRDRHTAAGVRSL